MGCKCTKTCVSSEFLTPSGSRAWPNGRLSCVTFICLYIHTNGERHSCVAGILLLNKLSFCFSDKIIIIIIIKHPVCVVRFVPPGPGSHKLLHLVRTVQYMPSTTHNYSHLLHLQERDTLFFPASNAWRHCFLPSTQHLEAPLRFGLGETELEQRRRTEGIRTFSLALAMVEIDEPGCPKDLLTLFAPEAQ